MWTTPGKAILPLIVGALAAVTAHAQEAASARPAEQVRADEIAALEPGVSSSDLDAAAPTVLPAQAVPAEDAAAAADIAVAAGEVRRRTSGYAVMDELDLGRTEITGNQELPKVLYIVPWQKSDPGDLTGKPINTLLDEVLAPIDRSEFMRQVEYYDELYREPDS